MTKIINQLINFEKRKATGSPIYRMLVNGLKKYYDVDWEEVKSYYL